MEGREEEAGSKTNAGMNKWRTPEAESQNPDISQRCVSP